MWIPDWEEPRDKNVKLAVITAAEAYGSNRALQELLELIEDSEREDETGFIMVCTEIAVGTGVVITPVMAHHANKAELFGEQETRDSRGMGKTGYSQTYAHRLLNVNKLPPTRPQINAFIVAKTTYTIRPSFMVFFL